MILAFITGAAAGGLFALLGLPSPAPNTFAGVVGIAGLVVGMKAAGSLL